MAGIVSYAQNFEDVMLWRALEHVENGFYIDLGAQDPLADSVSMAFHEHGWKGIHVEPTPHYAQLLREQRPGDTVIEAAVANAVDALSGQVRMMDMDSDRIPASRSLEEIVADPGLAGDREGALLSAITLVKN